MNFSLLVSSPRGQHGTEKTEEIGKPERLSSDRQAKIRPCSRVFSRSRGGAGGGRAAADGAGEVAGEGRVVGRSPRRGGPTATSTGDAAARPPDGAVLAPPLQPRTRAVRRPCGGTRRGSSPSAAAHARCRAAAAALGGGAGLRRGRGGEAVSGAGDDDAEAATAQGGAMAMLTSDAATATVEVSCNVPPPRGRARLHLAAF